jgi:hypothetical protein
MQLFSSLPPPTCPFWIQNRNWCGRQERKYQLPILDYWGGEDTRITRIPEGVFVFKVIKGNVE